MVVKQLAALTLVKETQWLILMQSVKTQQQILAIMQLPLLLPCLSLQRAMLLLRFPFLAVVLPKVMLSLIRVA
jgi:hypothetical protein